MDALNEAIAITGGVSSLARGLGVGQSTVSNWRARGTDVPPEHCVQIERLTEGNVRRWHTRPNDWHLIWPELIGTEGAPAVPAPVTQAAAA